MKSEVFNIDCMEGMKQFPDKYFDLAVVDPPYGIGEDGKANHSRGLLCKPTMYASKSWDSSPPSKEYFIELKRVSVNQIIFGANHFIENIPNANSSCWIVWDKVNGETDFADCELAYTSFKTAVRMKSFMWNGMLQGSAGNGKTMQGNKLLNEKRIHPTQKPVALYSWIYHNYLPQGGKVLDTHAGSMSNLIAAIKAGNIEMHAYELDKEYYEAAKKRVKNFQSQANIFQEPHNIIWKDSQSVVI